MNEFANVDVFGVKITESPSSIEVMDMIEWCKTQNINVMIRQLWGVSVQYRRTSHVGTGIMKTKTHRGMPIIERHVFTPQELEHNNNEAEVDGITFSPSKSSHKIENGKAYSTDIALGSAFFFSNKNDAAFFKLTWKL